MVTKREPKKQPFDVDAYVRAANDELNALPPGRLDEIYRKALEAPGFEESLAEADALYAQMKATGKLAIPRRKGSQRKRTS